MLILYSEFHTLWGQARGSGLRKSQLFTIKILEAEQPAQVLYAFLFLRKECSHVMPHRQYCGGSTTV